MSVPKTHAPTQRHAATGFAYKLDATRRIVNIVRASLGKADALASSLPLPGAPPLAKPPLGEVKLVSADKADASETREPDEVVGSHWTNNRFGLSAEIPAGLEYVRRPATLFVMRKGPMAAGLVYIPVPDSAEGRKSMLTLFERQIQSMLGPSKKLSEVTGTRTRSPARRACAANTPWRRLRR